MRERGWYDRKGVTVLEGKWQDFVGTQLLEDMPFDAVYTDTFSEEYEGEEQIYTRLDLLTRVAPPDLRLFFDRLPKLLAGPNARFSFFNGLGATSTYNAFLADTMLTAARCAFLRCVYALSGSSPLRTWHRRGVGRYRCCHARRGAMGQHARVLRYEAISATRL
jgi:hypothetical protein